MDKSQKELIKTYYRKRNIAASDDELGYGINNYEVNAYSIKNKLIPQNELTKSKIATSLVHAVGKNNVEKVKSLIQLGADVNGISDNDWNSVHSAIHHNNLDMLKLLIQLGADVSDIGDKHNWTNLMSAAYNGNLEMVKLLIKLGADDNINFKTHNGDTALSLGTREGHEDIVELLIQNGATKRKKWISHRKN